VTGFAKAVFTHIQVHEPYHGIQDTCVPDVMLVLNTDQISRQQLF